LDWKNSSCVISSPDVKFTKVSVVNSKNEFVDKEGDIEHFFEIKYQIEAYSEDLTFQLENVQDLHSFRYPGDNPFMSSSILYSHFKSELISKPARSEQIIEAPKPVVKEINPYVEGRPFVLFVQGGPGTDKERVCDMILDCYKDDNFIHLSIEEMVQKEASEE